MGAIKTAERYSCRVAINSLILLRSPILVKTSNRSVLMSVFTLAVRSAIAVSYAYGDVTGVTQTTPTSISARASGGGGDNVIL